MATVLAVKFVAMFAFYAFLHRAAELVLKDAALAALSALSLVGLYHVAWVSVMNYSNTLLLGAAMAASLYALLRLSDAHRLRDYAWLGLAIGLGSLAKYNFLLFAAPLIAAGLSHPTIRSRLLAKGTWVSAIVAAALVAPHAHWVVTSPMGFVRETGRELPYPEASAYWAGVGAGFLDFAEGALLFLSPFILILAAFFWRALRPLPEGSRSKAPYLVFLEIYLVGFVGLVAALIIAFGVTAFQKHWLMPLFPLPLYLFQRIRMANPGMRRLHGYAGTLALMAIVVVGAILVRAWTGPLYCRKCNFFVPYADLANGLLADGFRRGTVIAFDHPNFLTGNLRPYFPDSRFISTRQPGFAPAAPGARGACLIVWNPVINQEGGARSGATRVARDRLGAAIPADAPVRTVEAPMPRSRERTVRLEYLLFPDGLGECA